MGPRPVREMKPGLVRLGLTLKGFFGDPSRWLPVMRRGAHRRRSRESGCPVAAGQMVSSEQR
ncbi:hypothetical protein BZL30_1849 [Mycobacterium kansasii]|uniref:Uncharacterized protein n=1 Tax=Mycobacterium kansasii TaxID=1768 RepID=A0A1V3XJI5_MYCKA|nr:hypothetical protein BZL30_1849 [Mycobacterium kansasii]